MAAVITIVVVLICVFNYAFFEKYYINDRLKLLKNSYNEMKELCLSDDYKIDDVKEFISKKDSLYGIKTTYIDNKWNVVFSSGMNDKDTIVFFQDMIFNKAPYIEVIEENKEYSIVSNSPDNQSFSFLVIFGTLEDGSQVLMQITLDSIEENVTIFNRFVQIVGLGMLIIGIIVVHFISVRFTKPINELSEIAGKMSELDFGAKYTGTDNSEIGILGRSMNTLSTELEKNINELKEANIQLQKDIEIKEQNEEMRKEFLSNVSHELKTPLAIIQGYAEGLKEGVNDDRESLEYYCDVIMDETTKMNAMVKKLLTLNELEFGNEPIVLDDIEINDFIGGIIKSNSLRMEQKGIKLIFEKCDEFIVKMDCMQLEEVVANYLSNAINHCAGDKQIRITIKAEENSVIVYVYNTGENIPDEDIERIWEKLYKVDKARTREYGGNGIGLSIVKAIMDKNNGEYGVNNLPNGVEFWFKINN